MQNRKQLRRELLQKRRHLPVAFQQSAAQAVAKQITFSQIFQRHKHFAFYKAVQGELDPQLLLENAFNMQKKCYFPLMHPLKHNRLWFQHHEGDEAWQQNLYHIWEPKLNSSKLIPAWALDVVFVPLVGFDENGNRLGMGKGYYDRTFSFLIERKNAVKPQLIGLAYEFQKVPHLDHESWDVPLDAVVTEENFYQF